MGFFYYKNIMNITTIQSDIIWEDRISNLIKYQEKIDQIESTDLIILPEMFTTGFSMSPKDISENMDGETIHWMKQNANKTNSAICGSIVIEEYGKYFNRFIWVNPDGSIHHYDKRHLFAFAGEDQHYSAGNKRLIASVKGWKINLQICYDLRFPVWARQASNNEYDVLIYVANWPEKRSHVWKTLLVARAIENQAFVIGVNRVGLDGNNITHSGNSMVVGPLGEVMYHCQDQEAVFQITLNREELETTRNQFPFWKDADFFTIQST